MPGEGPWLKCPINSPLNCRDINTTGCRPGPLEPFWKGQSDVPRAQRWGICWHQQCWRSDLAGPAGAALPWVSGGPGESLGSEQVKSVLQRRTNAPPWQGLIRAWDRACHLHCPAWGTLVCHWRAAPVVPPLPSTLHPPEQDWL